jgi:hypothetical protein
MKPLPTVSINGISVRIDELGRYNLNDLHSAAVANGEASEEQRPSQFLRSRQVKRFVQTLSKVHICTLEQNQPLSVNHGGDNQGTWAHELIAIRYAAWINPEFEIHVYSKFKDAVLGRLDSLSQLNRLDLLIETETTEISNCARKMNRWGVGGRKKTLSYTREKVAEKVQLTLIR